MERIAFQNLTEMTVNESVNPQDEEMGCAEHRRPEMSVKFGRMKADQ